MDSMAGWRDNGQGERGKGKGERGWVIQIRAMRRGSVEGHGIGRGATEKKGEKTNQSIMQSRTIYIITHPHVHPISLAQDPSTS